MKTRSRPITASWEVSQEAVPVPVKQTKRKLTKGFFRQIVEEDLPDYLARTPDEKDRSSYEKLFQNGELKHGEAVVLGWVNYFWPMELDGDLVSKDGFWDDAAYGKSKSLKLLHVLWKNGNHYRRTLIVEADPIYPYLVRNLPQIFLGDNLQG